MRKEYVMGCYVLSLDYYDQERCCVMKPGAWPQKLQRLFGANEFAPNSNLRNGFVLLEVGSDKNAKLWAAKVLLLFRMHVKCCEDVNVISLVQHRDVTLPRDSVVRSLGCVSLPWNTDYDMNHTLVERDHGSGA